jgi:3-hydroxyisobutyrate dehydrogenase
LAPRILDGDLDPGFYVHHFIKDMSMALEAAIEENLDLPGLELALNRYRLLARQGGEMLGTQGLIRVYE